MDETRRIVDFVLQTGYGDLPPPVIEKAKICILDFLGAALFASTTDWNHILLDFVLSGGGREESTVIGCHWKTSVQHAALANGTMGHGFEVDDFHGKALLHPGAVVIPSVLAVSERGHANGKELIAAIVLGYEVMVRIGLAVGMSHSLRGFHPTGTNGPFGAAAAAGKVLGLRADQLLNAFGIAGSFSSGIREFYLEGGMIKRLHAGMAAQNGIVAALLANKGCTGPSTVLEGKFGYCRAFSDSCDLTHLERNLKETWEIENVSLKTYTCCGAIHPVVNGLLNLCRDHGIHPSEVERVVVETSERVARQNAGPGTKSVMASQHSIPFVSALTLLRDIEDPNVFNDEILRDEKVLSLARRVEVRGTLNDASINHCKVTLTLRDGKELITEIKKPKGDPENPLTYEEVVEKFTKFSRQAIPETRVKEIVMAVASLEEASDISHLSDLLRIEARRPESC